MTTPVTGTINSDVSDEGSDDGAEFLKAWENDDAETPSSPQEEKPKKKDAPQPDKSDEDEAAEIEAAKTEDDEVADALADEDEAEVEAEKPQTKRAATDDDEVSITVDGEERKVPVKDLKRLWGQEASLTKKSQEVADQRKAAEQQAAVHVTALSKLMDRSNAKLKEFEGIDFLVAQQEMDPEDFKRLRASAQAAYEEHQFITSELKQTAETIKSGRIAYVRENAPKMLEKIKVSIPEWNDTLYADLRNFAVENGVNREEIDMAIEPSVFVLLHDAMRYRKAKAAAEAKKAKVKAEAAKKPTKTVRTTSEASTGSNKGKGLEKLRRTGSVEDATNAFLDRWSE